MRKNRKTLMLTVLALAMSMGLSNLAFAAKKKDEETRTPITSISVTVQSKIEAEDEQDAASVLITSNNESLYSIGGYEWTTTKEAWEPGDKPQIQFEVHARSGYYFQKVSGKDKVQVNGAEYKSVKKANDDETLIIKVELKPAKGDLEEPDDAEWLGYPLGKATWDKVDYASAYELKLTRDGQIVYSVEKVTNNSYDFYPYMTRSGKYQFRVRAIPANLEEQGYLTAGEWVYSDTVDIDSDETAPFGTNSDNGSYGGSGGPDSQLAQQGPDSVGWVQDDEGWWYRNADGSYPKNTWMQIDNKWYLFGYDGYMMTGWQNKNGGTYYLGTNGDMKTGWVQEDREWYHFGQDGNMQKGWIQENGEWYYTDNNGKRYSGWLSNNGKWYYFYPETGKMARNTTVGGYYLNDNGEMAR